MFAAAAVIKSVISAQLPPGYRHDPRHTVQGHAVPYNPDLCIRGVQAGLDTVLHIEKMKLRKHDIILKNLPCCAILFNGYLCPCTGGFFMIYNYNRLWKLLIDKGMTKTQMRKAAGISTNILAKMGKDEPVSMDTFSKNLCRP